MLWNAVIWLLIGLVAGWLAGLVVKSRRFGLVGNLIMGLAGGLVGGILVQFLIDPAPDATLHWVTVITAALVAVVLVWMLNWITRGQTY